MKRRTAEEWANKHCEMCPGLGITGKCPAFPACSARLRVRDLVRRILKAERKGAK